MDLSSLDLEAMKNAQNVDTANFTMIYMTPFFVHIAIIGWKESAVIQNVTFVKKDPQNPFLKSA